MTHRKALLATAFGLALALSSVAQASTINLATAGCTGSACSVAYTGGTLDLVPVGGTFEYKSLNGETGLGVSGATGGEIDVREFINGTFSSAVTLDRFRVLFIYNGPEFGDPFEIAQVTADGVTVGTLTVNGENSAVWSLGGSVVSCGDTTETGTGCFDILDPFGTMALTTLSFTALHSATGIGTITNDSDYSLGSLDVTAVPEPASLLLLGLGLLGVARRRAS